MSISYNVTITNPGATGNGAGFIDHTKLAQYGPVSAITLVQSQAKKRGNFRFRQILEAIATMSNVKVVSSTATGATSTAEATDYQLTLEFASQASVFIVRDEAPITGAPAIKRLIAEAISTDVTHMSDYYAPSGPVYQTAELIVGKLVADVAAGLAVITVVAV